MNKSKSYTFSWVVALAKSPKLKRADFPLKRRTFGVSKIGGR